MRAEDLLSRIEHRPLRPFRVHLTDGAVLAVEAPTMVIVGRSMAVLPTRFGKDGEGRRIAERWRTVPHGAVQRPGQAW